MVKDLVSEKITSWTFVYGIIHKVGLETYTYLKNTLSMQSTQINKPHIVYILRLSVLNKYRTLVEI